MFYIKSILRFTVIIVCCIVSTTRSANAQAALISAEDSLLLNTTLGEFVKALEQKKANKIKELSLANVDCIMCASSLDTTGAASYKVPVDDFIRIAAEGVAKSPMLNAYHSRGYRMHVLPLKNVKNIGYDIYEVLIPTYLPEEWAVGNSGLVHVLQFVNVDGAFRFYGFHSVP